MMKDKARRSTSATKVEHPPALYGCEASRVCYRVCPMRHRKCSKLKLPKPNKKMLLGSGTGGTVSKLSKGPARRGSFKEARYIRVVPLEGPVSISVTVLSA